MKLLKVLGLGLTTEERAEREKARTEARAKKEFYKQLAIEGEYVADTIQRRLVELGLCYRYKKLDKRGILAPEVRPIDFEHVIPTPEAHYLKVRTRSMPRGITVTMLRDEAIVDSLGYSVGTPVTCTFTPEKGFWYVIPRKGRLGGIKNFVRYADALGELPKQAPRLAYPVGFGVNHRYTWDDLEENANLLVGGPKGSGKSNILNMILCTFIQRCSPQDLRMFMIDMKGGMELSFYRGIPHLGGDVPYKDKKTGEEGAPLGQKIIKHGPEVIKTLEYVQRELERRAHLLEGKVRKVSTWNKRYKKHALSYWVVLIDELAALMLDDRYRGDANKLLADIGARGRAVGIFLIIATQVPTSEVVTRLLKGNMDTRISFHCADGPSSMIMVDSWNAFYLPKIVGRVLSVGGHNTHGEATEIQTPYMPDDLVKEIVARVKSPDMQYSAELPKHDVTAEELFRWALANDEGRFSTHDVFDAFKKRGITYKEVCDIAKRYTEQELVIEIDDKPYKLQEADGPNPRKLVECGMWNEESLAGGDPDEPIEADETFSESPTDLQNLIESDLPPTDTPIERDSGEIERDSDKNERDSDGEAHSENGNGVPRDGETILKWQAAEPVKGVRGELSNRTNALDWVSAAALWDGELRDSVKAWKYHGNEQHLDAFKDILVDHFMAAWPFGDRKPDALVPVPLHPQREEPRGFNQALLLAEALSAATGIEVLNPLIRIRHTQPQVTQRDEYRGSNVKDAFVSTLESVPPVILIIDDLVTSGATMSECAAVLKKCGAQWVGGLALARPPLKVSKKIIELARSMPPLEPTPLPADENGNGHGGGLDWVDAIVDREMKKNHAR